MTSEPLYEESKATTMVKLKLGNLPRLFEDDRGFKILEDFEDEEILYNDTLVHSFMLEEESAAVKDSLREVVSGGSVAQRKKSHV